MKSPKIYPPNFRKMDKMQQVLYIRQNPTNPIYSNTRWSGKDLVPKTNERSKSPVGAHVWCKQQFMDSRVLFVDRSKMLFIYWGYRAYWQIFLLLVEWNFALAELELWRKFSVRKSNNERHGRPAAVYSWSAKASKGLVRVWARAVPCSVKTEGSGL